MPKFLVTYDLSDASDKASTAFEIAAGKLGWSTKVVSSKDVSYLLPRGTLIGSFNDIETAAKAFDAIPKPAEKLLGKAIAVQKHFLASASDVRYSSNERRGV